MKPAAQKPTQPEARPAFGDSTDQMLTAGAQEPTTFSALQKSPDQYVYASGFTLAKE